MSRQQKQVDTNGMSRQSTITGFLTGSKRKQTVGPFEQETQKKNTKIQKCSEGSKAIDSDLDLLDCKQ